LDIRVIPADMQKIIPHIESLVAPYVETKILHKTVPHDIPRENPYIQQLQTIGRERRGEEFPFVKAHATSDIRHICEVNGAGIEFGPIGENAHQDSEWVDIQSLEEYYQILKAFLLSIK
jgi:acetylornithine deacetylase/succinyl-diaminopimelate desuccinylase-like protein